MPITGWIGTVALIAVVLLGALAAIRERLVDGGWPMPKWVVRATHRAAAQRVARDAALIGGGYARGSRNALDAALARKQLPDGVRKRPDVHLLRDLRGWTIELPEHADFRGLREYIDTMGAVSRDEDGEDRFATISVAWLAALQGANAIEPFDCILSVKEGNPILAHDVGRRLSRSQDRSVHTVFCKGPRDPAKVSGRHETDFEGLRAFREDKPIARNADGRYRAIVFDDNCTSGRTISEAVRRFNEFVSGHQESYPFAPVSTAVVLFVVLTGEPNDLLESEDMALHALLAFDEDAMKRVRTESFKTLKSDIDGFKNHPACVVSRTLDAKNQTTSD